MTVRVALLFNSAVPLVLYSKTWFALSAVMVMAKTP